MDLKAFTEHFYHHITGAHLQPVLEILLYLKRETPVWLEVTTLLIPGVNDSDQELAALTQWVVTHLGPDVPLHFTAFHADWKMLDTPPTPPAILIRARRIAMQNGMRYVYTGNIRHVEGSSTFCHECHRKIIGRDGYVITDWHLTTKSRCQFCGTVCTGVFAGNAKTGAENACRCLSQKSSRTLRAGEK